MQSPAPADILSYHARRRLRRAIQFVAATMRTTKIEEVSSTGAPVAELKYLPDVQVQLGAVRQPPESRGAGPLRPDIAAWARLRQTSVIIAHLRDPLPDLAEVVFTLAFYDVGVATFERYFLWTEPGSCPLSGQRWWMIGGNDNDILIQLGREGPVPTLTKPWKTEEEREAGEARADALISAFIWNG
jgi:hypothetical protein